MTERFYKTDFCSIHQSPWKNVKFAATATSPMKPAKRKGSNRALEAGFCCLRHRPDETRQAQRQQPRLKKQDFAATAAGPMKPTKHKGSNHASESRFCCHRHKSHEIRQAQRQHTRLRIEILLPPPQTR